MYISLGKDFIKEVLETCERRLTISGMRRRKSGIGTWPLSDDFQGWIGLNVETRRGDGTMVVNPNVGVRCDRIHRIIASVRSEKFHAYSPPTIVQGLGYLMPQRTYVPFVFHKNTRISQVADDLADAVEQYGIPYMRRNANLKAIIERLDRPPRQAGWEESGERLLAAYHVAGDREGIERVISERIDEGEEKAVNLKGFVDFSNRLLKYIAEEDGSR